MDGKRLTPETLQSIPGDFGSILPDHQVIIEHVSGKMLKRRKGHYLLTVDGPIYGGRWHFFSGRLERLSRNAARAVN